MCLMAGSAAGPAAPPFPVVPDVVVVDAACKVLAVSVPVSWLALHCCLLEIVDVNNTHCMIGSAHAVFTRMSIREGQQHTGRTGACCKAALPSQPGAQHVQQREQRLHTQLPLAAALPTPQHSLHLHTAGRLTVLQVPEMPSAQGLMHNSLQPAG